MDPLTPNSSFPYSREIRKPFFLLRTADGLGNFFKREIVKSLFSRRDPLTRFLANAQLDTSTRPPRILYDLPGIDTATLQPLDFLSRNELESFREAAKEFYRKALPSAERVTPFEQELRRSFRLPDPDREPDAYWTYGPPENRRLLIVWGCEFEPDTSLPLVPEAFVEGPTIYDRLEARLMPWKGMQERALALLEGGEESLRGFIGRPRRGPKGDLKSIIARGKVIPLDACKPAAFIPRRLVDSFEAAARSFYLRAEAEDVPAFERELRLALRLPDPSRKPDAYFLSPHKDAVGLLILVEGSEEREECLPIAEVEEIDFPAPEKDASGHMSVPETVVSRMREKRKPWAWKAVAGAVVGLVLVAGILRLAFPPDQDPPAIKEVGTTLDPGLVVVDFNEPIDPASLLHDEEVTWRDAANRDELPAPIRHFTLRNSQGLVVGILAHEVSEENPQRVKLTVPEMSDDSSYRLEIQGVTDLAGNALVDDGSHSFIFRDRTPPALVKVSGDSTDSRVVVAVFDEPLLEADAERSDNYEIGNFVIKEAMLDSDGVSVYLSATNPLQDNERYELRVRGVSDRSVSRNSIRDWVSQPFVYADTIPPGVESVQANGNQVTVLVTFREMVEPLSASTRGNYIIRDPQGQVLEVLEAVPQEDNRRVTLRTEPLHHQTAYALQVLNVVDNAGNPTDGEATTDFAFTGVPDTEPPVVMSAKVLGDNRTIRIAFSEAVEPGLIEDPANWAIDDDEIQIESISPRRGSENEYHVRLSLPLPALQDRPGRESYILTINRLEDLLGNFDEAKNRVYPRGVGLLSPVYVQIASMRPYDDGAMLEVTFTEDIADGSAANPDNFRIVRVEDARGAPGSEVSIVEIMKPQGSDRKVRIRFSEALSPGSYRLECRNLLLLERADLRTERVPPEIFSVGAQ